MHIGVRVRPGDDNEELRYTLRSLQNVPHESVTIAGYAPTWTNTQHLQIQQDAEPAVNALTVLRAFLADGPDDVAIFDDDMYVTAPIDDIPVLHTGPLLDAIHARSDDPRHHRAAEATADVLAILGVTNPLCYDLHTPFPASRTALLETLDIVADIDRSPRILWKTVHANLHRYDGAHWHDVKIRDGLARDTWPTPFMSTHDSTYWGPAGHWLRRTFPTPSPYEVT